MTEHEQHLHRGLFPALLAIVGVALIYVGVIIKNDFDLKQSEVEHSLDIYADTTLTRVEKLFSGYESVLGAIAESHCIRAVDQAVCREFFPRLLSRFPAAVNFAATDRVGNVFASSRPFDPLALKPPSVQHLPFFKALAAGQQQYIMDPHIGPVSGEQIIGVALPLRGDDGRFAGVIGVTIRFEQIQRLWEEVSSSAPHSLVIFDRHNQPIFSSGALKSRSGLASELAPMLLKEGPGSVVIDGERVLTHTDMLRAGEWKIVVLAPAASSLQVYLSGNPLLFILALPILLLALLGSLIYSREQRATRLLVASEERLRRSYAQLEAKVAERTTDLADSEQHWRLLLDSTAEAIYGIDLDGKCTFCNPAALRMLGETSAGALLGVEMHARTHYLKPDGAPYPVDECPIIGVLSSGEEVFVADENFFRADGSSFPVRYGAHPVRRDGMIVGAVVTFSDISETRQKENEYRSLIQASIDGFWINDFSGRIVDANEALCRMLGYSREELLAMTISDIEARETPQETAKHIHHLIMSGSQQFQSQHQRKDGTVIDVEISVLYVAALGQRFFVFVRDISERVRLEEQLHNHQINLEILVQKRTADLEDALEAAQLADHAKDAFLANVSHELRTPLNAVIGMSDLARRLSHDPAQQAYLDKVGNAGQTLAHLIDDLLDLSKIVAGRMEFENATFSLRALVERSNSVMSYKATEKGLQLTEQIADDVPDLLIGDPHRIEQILLNLLSNAIKFTAAGHIDIRLSALEQQAERLCLAIEIEDTGVGLSHEEIDRLFKPFAQADATMTRRYGGSGLGLAICKRLAEMMDGQISVSSQPGHGSTFRVILWLRLGKAEDLHPNQLTGQRTGPLSSQPSLPASYRDTRILVVDDQALNREIVEALLKFVGITPRMASDGQQALDLLDAGGPDAFDLILMDIQMPVMDGLSATRELRNRKGFQTLPIIAMTAHTMEHEKEISAKAGMNDHIGKPFDNESFYRTLAKWIPQAKHLTHHRLADPVQQSTPPPADGFPLLKGIDSEGGLSRLAGNEERYRHWLADFVEEGPATARQIRQTLAAGNNESARQVAHAFKGRVGMLGMNELHRVVSELEAALKRGDPVEGWLNKLEQVIEQTRHDIKRTLNLPDHAPQTEVLPERAPQGPMPEPVAHLVELLEAGDGASAAAIARCLNEYKGTDWAPRLQRALSHAQNFDFAAAGKAILTEGMG